MPHIHEDSTGRSLTARLRRRGLIDYTLRAALSASLGGAGRRRGNKALHDRIFAMQLRSFIFMGFFA
ncbi:MAG: L,D-transpeptidase, partial [Mesorhizobium sp.]